MEKKAPGDGSCREFRDGGAIARLRQEIAERLRGLLKVAPASDMAAPDTFEKSGIHNVALFVREGSSHDDVKGRCP